MAMTRKMAAAEGSTAPIQKVSVEGMGGKSGCLTRNSEMVVKLITARRDAKVILSWRLRFLYMNTVTSGSTVITIAMSNEG